MRLVQRGLMPTDWKPMPTIGSGVLEMGVSDASNTYRVIDIAKSTNAVYVLHCFQKKTKKTSKPDIDVATKRFKELLKEFRP